MKIKISSLRKLIREVVESVMTETQLPMETDSDIQKMSINDVFIVNGSGLESVKKSLEKANKNLRTRNMPELKLNVLSTKTYEFDDPDPKIPEKIKVVGFEVKIDGDVPELHDYEFIAKIEHTEAGNIINLNPRSSVSSLPPEYRTFRQRCDICKSDRERNSTFIIKKLATDELIVAGSTCLKKFLPLDVVKGFLEYAVQLEAMRSMLADAFISMKSGAREPREKEYLDPEVYLTFCCIAYYADGKKYMSNKKAQENDKQSTSSFANYLMWAPHKDTQAHEIIRQYRSEGEAMAKKITDWMKTYDFDEKAIENPGMENYFQNMKVLSNLGYITPRNTNYYSSFLALYLRETQSFAKKEKLESNYVGQIGEKIKVTVKVLNNRTFDTQYGVSTVYNFLDDNGNKITWFASGAGTAELTDISGTDTKVTIVGTVKAQQISKFDQQKETVVIRVKVVPTK